jgi:cephalosporin hydroxylase
MAMRTSPLLGSLASVLLASAAMSGEFSKTAPWRGAPDEQAIEVAMGAAQFDRKEHQTSWLGVEMVEYSGDLITYQLLVNEVKPELVIETGTFSGGLSLYLATVLQAVQPEGRVVTIDIDSSHQIIPVLAEPGRNRTVENEGC